MDKITFPFRQLIGQTFQELNTRATGVCLLANNSVGGLRIRLVEYSKVIADHWVQKVYSALFEVILLVNFLMAKDLY